MKVKICGLTTPKEAIYLNTCGADLAGVVLFCPKSKRNVTPMQASSILAALHPDIKKVAVTVSPTLEQILEIQALGFDYIQIHGSLPGQLPESVRIPILKAFNLKDLDTYPALSSRSEIAGYVFDAQEPGSGKTFDWSILTGLPRDQKLFILAGGLTPQNVAAAIAAVRPDIVDVSSGVEYPDRPGKDPLLIRQFIRNAKENP